MNKVGYSKELHAQLSFGVVVLLTMHEFGCLATDITTLVTCTVMLDSWLALETLVLVHVSLLVEDTEKPEALITASSYCIERIFHLSCRLFKASKSDLTFRISARLVWHGHVSNSNDSQLAFAGPSEFRH